MSDDQATNDPEAEGGRGKSMGFLDHLEELRWTLIKCAVVFAIFVTIIAYNLDEASHLLLSPLKQVQADFPKLTTDLVTNSPMGVFSVMIDICLLGGLIVWARATYRAARHVDFAKVRLSVELCTVYWHFLFIVWACLFAVLLYSHR